MSAKSIELSITGITESNKRIKLITAARALLEQMGIDGDIEAPWLEKAKTHKYISKKRVNGQWVYEYPQTNNERRINAASQITDIMTNIQPLAVNPGNARRLINTFKKDFINAVNSGLYARHLQNRRVAGIVDNHLTVKRGNKRQFIDIENHVKYLPFVIPLIQKYGHVSHSRVTGGRRYYELTGKADIGGKKHSVSIVLSDDDNNKINLVCVSTFGFSNRMVKAIGSVRSVALARDGNLRWSRWKRRGTLPPLCPDSLNSSDHAPMRQSSHERTAKRLYPTTIEAVSSLPQIRAKSIETHPDMEISIQDITAENRKAKFAKAIGAVSRRLGVPVHIGGKGGPGHTHEPYFYPVQQELSDKWTGYYSRLLREAYKAVCGALGLPEANVEVLRKSIDGSGPLRYRGKIVYNPETGQPISNRDFDNLIEGIQQFLNRNTKDIARQILLDSVTIKKLLKRIARCSASADIEKIKLENLKYRGKTFDWIRDDFKNLAHVLGEPFTRSEMARYQAAADYVGQLVTKTNDNIRNEIKQTVLSGIRDRRTKGQVAQDLFNRLGSMNRDWKRIADTELVNTSNLAGILEDVNEAPEGEKVYFKRYERPGCCDKCEAINGTIALWSNTHLESDRIEDDHAKIAIWEGKPRDKGIGTGTLHPNCRGGWARWGGKKADAMEAEIQGKIEAWDKAVKQAKREWAEKGVENPNDQTPGYVDRINELYREKLDGEA